MSSRIDWSSVIQDLDDDLKDGDGVEAIARYVVHSATIVFYSAPINHGLINALLLLLSLIIPSS